MAVEAGSTFGWARWVGETGTAVGIDHFGASAPAATLYERFGVTTDEVVAATRASLAKVGGARAGASA